MTPKLIHSDNRKRKKGCTSAGPFSSSIGLIVSVAF